MSRLLAVDANDRMLACAVADVRLGLVRTGGGARAELPSSSGERGPELLRILGEWRRKFDAAQVIVGLPSRYFSFVSLSMPPLGREDMSRALAFELEKHLPLGVEEYHFDFISGRKGPEAVPVMVVAMKRTLYEEAVGPYREAGFGIAGVTCTALEVQRAVWDKAAAGGVFLFSDESAVDMLGLRSGAPAFHRRFRRTDDLRAESEAFMQAYPGTLLCAGDVLPAEFEGMGGRRVQTDHALLLAGSAAGRRRALNLVPLEQRPLRVDYYPRVLWALGILSFVFFLSGSLAGYVKDRSALAKVGHRIEELKKNANTAIEARRKYDALLTGGKTLSAFVEKRAAAVRALDALSRTVPDSVWIVNLTIEDSGKIELEGIAKKTSDLVSALEKSSSFKSIAFTMPITYKPGEERFALKMEFSE